MSNKINIVGSYKENGLTKADIENAVKAVFDILDTEKTINIAFVEPKEIQAKNLEYRKKDKPTDVLSFNYGDEGDILLCAGEIESMKEGYESLSEAVQKTLIHGTLHLFGYNHEKEKDRAIMENMEGEIFDSLG